MLSWRHCVPPVLALLAAAGASAAAPGSSGGPVYKWLDDKGVVHYGDSVPSEYSQSERSVLNSQGVEVGHVEGTKNAVQQAEANRAEFVAAQRAQHDRFLLQTYVSSKDIEQLRDERLDQIDGQIKAASTYIDNLSTRLDSLVARGMQYKPYSTDPSAHRMPDEFAEELVRTSNESRTQKIALEAKRKEQIDTRAQFEADIQRYHELTASRGKP